MTVALDQTLIAAGIHQLEKEEGFMRVEEGKTTGTGTSRQFIGAGVSRFGQTSPNIHLCGENEPLWGIVIGLTNKETIPEQGSFYNDYDQPYASGKWVSIGIMKPGGIYLVLSGTNTTWAIDNKLKCVDGVFTLADTNDNYQMVAEQTLTGASDTRKYGYARFVKN